MKVKNKKNIALVLTCALTSTIMVGCTDDLNIEDKRTLTELYVELSTFSSNKYKKYEAVIKDFNLGKKSFENKINIDIKGLISYPKEKENAPVLVVLAGNENVVKGEISANKTLYKGYEYLAKDLAESGFLTLVIDTQFKDSKIDEDEIVEDKILEQLYDYHIDNLEKSINGENIYGINVYKKGNLNKIGLVGQSSTARNIFNIANKKYSEGNKSIKGLLSITPGESLSLATSYPDLPTAILVAEHSLNTRIGFDMYNDIEKSKNRNSFANLTYLIGGDSKKFNQRLEEDKILEAKVDEIKKENKDINKEDITLNKKIRRSIDENKNVENNVKDIIKEENLLKNENTDLVIDATLHENFLSSYCTSFFKSIFEKDKEFENRVNGKTPSVTKMYGMDVLNKYYTKSKNVVYSGDSLNNIKTSRLSVEDVVESSVLDLDTAINFNEPTTNVELPLKKLVWEKENPRLSVPITSKDCSEFKALNIRWAIDSYSALNVVSQKVATVTLEDNKGNYSSVVLNLENALRKVEGREINNENGSSNWSRYTPLSDSRIPLDKFKDIDLENIKNIIISFENSSSGSVYLNEISFVK